MAEKRCSKQQYLIRQLRYRLQRQGMLELDVWLAPLQQALEKDDAQVTQVIEDIMCYEVPELLAMQSGKRPIPEELKPWLGI